MTFHMTDERAEEIAEGMRRGLFSQFTRPPRHLRQRFRYMEGERVARGVIIRRFYDFGGTFAAYDVLTDYGETITVMQRHVIEAARQAA